MRLRSLKDNIRATVDLGVVLMIGIAFAGLMVVSFIIYTVQTQFNPTADTPAFNTMRNITRGWDDATNLILVAITIFILAIAIAALLLLRGR